MKNAILFAALCALVTSPVMPIGALPALAGASEQSSPQDRQRFVSVVRKLEAAPLDPGLLNDRDWAFAWLSDAPDISVSVCMDPLNGAVDGSYRYKGEILIQYVLGMGAFLIENPGKEADFDAQQVAGVESALKAYRAMRAARPQEQSPELDDLLALQGRGQLAQFVAQAFATCQSKSGK